MTKKFISNLREAVLLILYVAGFFLVFFGALFGCDKCADAFDRNCKRQREIKKLEAEFYNETYDKLYYRYRDEADTARNENDRIAAQHAMEHMREMEKEDLRKLDSLKKITWQLW